MKNTVLNSCSAKVPPVIRKRRMAKAGVVLACLALMLFFTTTLQAGHVRTVADVDGDGKADIVAFGYSDVLVSLSNGKQFLPQKSWIADYSDKQGWGDEDYVRTLGDVNGDGKADIVAFGHSSVLVSLSTGRGFAPQKIWINDYARTSGWKAGRDYRAVTDVDGDGLDDIIAAKDGAIYYSRSSGTSFAAKKVLLSGAYDAKVHALPTSHISFGDMNGDKKADIVLYTVNAATPLLSYRGGFSRGNPISFGTKWTSLYAPRTLADVNGDRKADLVGFSGNGPYVRMSGNTAGPTHWVAGFSFNAGGWESRKHVRVLGDVNGDGADDVVGFGSNMVYVSTSNKSSFAEPTPWLRDYGFNSGWMVANSKSFPAVKPQVVINKPQRYPSANVAADSGEFYQGKTNLGKGYNLFALKSDDTICNQVRAFSKNGSSVEIFRNPIQIPSNLVYNTTTNAVFTSQSSAKTSISKVQKALQTSLGVEGSYSGVTASLKAGYGENSVKSRSTSFVEYRAAIKPLVVGFNAGMTPSVTPGFDAQTRKFASLTWDQSPSTYRAFFETYGTHYVKKVTMGAECTMRASVRHTSNLNERDLELAAAAAFKSAAFGAGIESSVKTKTSRFQSETASTLRYDARGGRANQIVDKQLTPANWKAWMDTVYENGNLRDIDRSLAPIYTVVTHPAARRNIEAALKKFAAENNAQLPDDQFVPTVYEYQVKVQLRELHIQNDSDTGVDAGDMFWEVNGKVVDPRTKVEKERVLIDERKADNIIKLRSGSKSKWKDIQGRGASHQWDVSPGKVIVLGGYFYDKDTSNHDLIGNVNSRSNTINPATFTGTRYFETQLSGKGSAKLYYAVTVTPMQ